MLIGLIAVVVVVGFCIRLLYDDVMKDDADFPSATSQNQRFYGYFSATFIVLSLYILYSIYSCWAHYEEDRRVLRSYKISSKKVRDMSARQKARRRQGENALWRKEHLYCRYNPLKIIGVVATLVAIFVVRPRAKQKRDLTFFVLLCVLMLPAFFVVGVAFVAAPFAGSRKMKLGGKGRDKNQQI